MTATKLSRRLTFHLAFGAPKSHTHEKHRAIIIREYLEKNTEIITSAADPRRLAILEALYIKKEKPTLNIQAQELQGLPSMRTTVLPNTIEPNAGLSEAAPSQSEARKNQLDPQPIRVHHTQSNQQAPHAINM